MFEQTNITKQKLKQRHPLELTVDSATQQHLRNPHTGLCATCISFYVYSRTSVPLNIALIVRSNVNDRYSKLK